MRREGTDHHSRRAHLVLLLGTASFLALPVNAAEPQLAQAQPVEEVLITGSLIAGAPAVGVPVTAVGQEDFIESGALSITDYLRNVPSLEVQAAPSPAFGGGRLTLSQNVQIHGLGTGQGVETLLMVNGLRWPPQNYSGDTVDPSIIPQIAVERMDVLTAGASAVYGSDATAGVINIIMRRGFDGGMTQARFGTSEMGNTGVQFAQLYGTTWETGDITVSYEFTNDKHTEGGILPYFTTNFEPYGLFDRRNLGSSVPGVVTTGNPVNAATAPTGFSALFGSLFCANCYSVPQGAGWNFGEQAPGPTTSWAQLLNNPGSRNLRDGWFDGWSRPHNQASRATLTFDQDLATNLFGLADVSLFVDAFYSNRRGVIHYPPPNGNALEQFSPNNGYTVPTNNPYRPSGVPTGTIVRAHFSLGPEMPQRTTGGEVAGRYAFGFNLDNLPFDWNGKLTYSMSEDYNFGFAGGMVNRNNLLAALGNTIASQAAQGTVPGQAAYIKPANIPYLNPFCDSRRYQCNDPLTLAYIAGYRNQYSRWKIQETGFNFNGPVWELPAGPILAAIAGQNLTHHFHFQDSVNARSHSNALIQTSDQFEKQQSWALFGQVNVPIFGDDFAFPLMERLEIEAGYRYDKYNTLGDGIWTPKIAANWGLGYGLTIRGAWGKSFRAPAFGENSAVMSVIEGRNVLGGEAGGINSQLLDCGLINSANQPVGTPIGTAAPGSLTALLNPTCNTTNSALFAPGGINVSGTGRGAAVILRGGTGLKPQTVYQWNLGVNFAPADGFLQGLNLDATYFHLRFEDLITGGFPGRGPNDPASRERFTVIPNPNLPITDPSNAAYLALVQEIAVTPSRGAGSFDPALIPNIRFIRDAALTNVGWRELSGVDFNGRYDWDMGNWGAWHVGFSGYYEVNDRNQVNPSSPINETYEGEHSGSRLKRVRYRVGWTDESWSITGFANYFGHGALNTNGNTITAPCFFSPAFGPGNPSSTAFGGLCYPGAGYFGPYDVYPNFSPATVYFDLSIGYQTGDRPANPYLQNLGFQLTINNVLNKPPPFQVGARGSLRDLRAFDNEISEQKRIVNISVTKVW